jgi:hypothetical protein
MKILRLLTHRLLPIALCLSCTLGVHAQQAVRVDNATKVLSDPASFWTANAADIAAAAAAAFADDAIEINQVSGLQTALDAKLAITTAASTYQPLDSDLTSIAALSTTSFGRSLLTQADAIATRTALGLGTAATTASTAYATAVQGTKADAVGAITGLVSSNGSATFTARTITGTAPITVTNGNGASGNPTVAITAATTSATGSVQLATSAETITGTDTAKVVTPAGNKAALDLVKAMDAYRAPEPWLYIDGVTTSRAAGVFALGTRGNIAGVPTASWVGWVDVPTTNPASSAWVSSIQSNTSGFFPANNIGISFASNGALLVNADAGGGNYRNYQWLGFRAAYSGQRIWLEVRLTQGTSNPVIRVNGVDISSTFIVVTGGTPPPWLDSSVVATFCLNGFNWPAGPAPRGCWINAQLTDVESDDWRLRGVIPPWVRSGGSAKLAVNSDFSAGSDGWSPANGTVTGNVDSIGGVNDTLEINAAGGTSAAAVVAHGLLVKGGDKARVRFDVYRPSSNTVGTFIGLRNSGSAISDQAVQPLADTWTSYDLVMTWPQTNDPGLQFRLSVSPSSGGTLGTADKFYLKNVKVSPLGALILPEVTPDNVLRDASLATPPIDGYTVGCTPQIGAADGWIRARRTSDGFLMVDGQIVGTGRGIVQVMARSVSGGTITLGDTAGAPATLVASVSLSAGVVTPLTLLKSLTTGGKVYLDLGTATDAEIFIRTGPITSLN